MLISCNPDIEVLFEDGGYVRYERWIQLQNL